MEVQFSENTLVIYRVTFNLRRKPDRLLSPFKNDGLNGKNLFNIFEQFCNQNQQVFPIGSSGRYARITDPDISSSDSCMLVHVKSGNDINFVQVTDINSSEVEYEYGNGKVGLVDSRILLYKNENINAVFFAIEHVKNGAGDTTFIKAFKDYLAKVDNKLVMKYDMEVLEIPRNRTKGIKSFEIKQTVRSRDDGGDKAFVTQGAKLVYKLNHPRLRYFPWRLFDKFKENPTKMYGVFHIPAEFQSDCEVYFTVTDNDNKDRTFRFNDEVRFPARELLNPSGEPPISDIKYIELCRERCEEIIQRSPRNPS